MGSDTTCPTGLLTSSVPREKPQVRPTDQPPVFMASRRDCTSGRAPRSRDLSMRSQVLHPTYAALHATPVPKLTEASQQTLSGQF